MISYKSLYYTMVRSVDDALTYMDEGDIPRARGVVQSALHAAEEAVIERDMFPSPVTGEMYYPDSIVNLHKKILKNAGLPHIRFHEGNHS